MAEQSLDCYVSFDPVNVYYLTNFTNFLHERPFILIIGKQGMPTTLASYLELTHVKACSRTGLDYVT